METHTARILCLVPTAVAPNVLRLLLLVPALPKHLVEEAELQAGAEEPGREDRESHV